MKEFTVGKEKVTVIVDDEDFIRVSKYKWFVCSKGNYKRIANRQKKCGYNYLHQFIMKTTGIDHINNNPLDNRKINLRKCSCKENCRNKGASKNNTSGYKGVVYANERSWPQLKKRWIAQIKVDYKHKKLGYFSSAKEAAAAYNKAAIQYFGEFAKLNSIKRTI